VSGGVPEDVAELIESHIDSVEKLEILLLLRGERDREWTSDQVSRELRRNPSTVSRALGQLAERGLLGGSTAAGFRFAPTDGPMEQQVTRLAETYATRRVSVIQLIVANPMDSVTTFADAFRFRKKD
jgi:DNA-binding transcriptional MocR family regulator